MDARTHQFRTALIRRIKNVYPAWKFEIAEFQDGIALQLIDEDGTPCGREAKFYGSRSVEISKTALVKQTGIEPSKL